MSEENPYQAPESTGGRELLPAYAGFAPRLGAGLVDAVLTLPLAFFAALWAMEQAGDEGSLLLFVIPILYLLAFWQSQGATPGKLIFGIRIVDARGNNPDAGACMLRLAGYGLSTIALGVGFLWMLWDPENQCWHDKLARTHVIPR